ncbi:MAG: hypothetical protein R3Y62_05200 [Eubacteriales bacterium]
MLKLKNPIKLHTAEPMQISTDAFEQRVLSNYQTIGAHLIPEDLLHLTTAPMEVFLQEGNMTSLVVDNRLTTSQNVKLDLINNIINRIALNDSATLTYQDQVYITNMLQKLGVQDVHDFMKTINQLRTEQIQSHKLVEQYRSTVLEYMGRPAELESQAKGVTGDQGEGEMTSGDQSWFLHQDIYRRLGTIENIYQIEGHSTNIEGDGYRISRNQLLQSEYMRMANTLLLAEYRGYVTQQLHGPAVMGTNPYEYPVVTEQLTTEEITAQLSQSVLYNTLSQLFTSRIHQFVAGNQHNFNLTRALSKTAENSVRRFEINHNEGRVLQASHHLQQSAMNQLLQNEYNILEHYNGFLQYTAEEQRYLEQHTEIWQGNRLNMTYLSQFSQENLEETLLEQTVSQEDASGETTAPMRPKEVTKETETPVGVPTPPSPNVEQQVALTEMFRREMLHQERMQVQNQMMIGLHNLFQVVNTMTYLKQQDVAQILALRNFNVSNDDLLVQKMLLSNSMAYVEQTEQYDMSQSADLHHQETNVTEEESVTEVTVEERNNALKQYLQEINNENVRRREILKETLSKVTVEQPKTIAPNLERTKELAILSIRSPEKLKEFLAQAEKVDTSKPVNAQVEAILSILDPVTRQLMERAIYHSDVTRNISSSNVQQNTNLLQLMSDINNIQELTQVGTLDPLSQVETVHHRMDTETHTQEGGLVETLLEQAVSPQEAPLEQETLERVLHGVTNIQTTTQGEISQLQSRVDTILRTADLETRMEVETLLEKTLEQQFKLEDDQARKQVLAEMTTQLTQLETKLLEQPKAMGEHLRTILQNNNESVQQLVERYLQHQVAQHTENNQILREQTTLSQLLMELRQFQTREVAGIAGRDGEPGGIGMAGLSLHHTTQQVELGQGTAGQDGTDGAVTRETTQTDTQTSINRATREFTVLERIFRRMEQVMPAESVARVIQRELMEYTNLHETRQVFRQLEQYRQQVYDQVVEQYETVEKIQKEQIVQVLTEKTKQQVHQEVTEVETLRLEHHHTEDLVSEQVSQTIADILYGTVAAVGPEYAETMVRQSVPMVLKQMEAEIPEELTELIQSKQLVQVEKEELQVVQQEKKVTTVQSTKLEEELQAYDAAENVRKLVEKSIKGQVSAITDQVYQKLERRLQLERSRRGK